MHNSCSLQISDNVEVAEKTTLGSKSQVDARRKSSSVAHHSILETDSMQRDRSEILAFYDNYRNYLDLSFKH